MPLIAGAGDFGRLSPKAGKFTTAPTKTSRPGDIILCIRATIGDRNWSDIPYCLGRGVAGLTADRKKLDQNFLWHWLEHVAPALKAKGRGATFLQVNKADISSLEVRLPPLPEQRRIATILDKADALRTQRRAAITKLDALLQSAFIDMFGDPVENPKGWPRVAFSEILERIESGTSPVCLDRPKEDSEWGVLKLGAVTRCVFDPSANKALPTGTSFNENLEVKKGDLLFSRKNTYDLIAACAYVSRTPERLLLPDLIFRFLLKNSAPATLRYLQALLTHPRKRREIQSLAGGSAGSMPNISKSKLNTALIELPPLELQVRFAQVAENIERHKHTLKHHANQLDILFASLQHRAFAGEL